MIIIYLGRRGGGSQLLMSALLGLEDSKCVSQVWISESNEDLDYLKSRNYNLRIFSVAHSFRSLISPFVLFRFVVTLFELLWFTSISSSKIFVQIMPSPLDIVIDVAARLRNRYVVRVIHDFKNHPGEKWPTESAIEIRARFATHIVVFSKYVLENLSNIEKKISFVTNLPSTLVIHGDVGEEVSIFGRRLLDSSLPVVLVIGRAHSYKGHKFLDKLSKELSQTCIFVIAGEGIQDSLESDNMVLINKWLSDAEFDHLLDISQIVLFPYTEASQSGTIPLARAKGKFIICSDKGGLPEQVDGYQDAIVLKKIDLVSIEAGVRTALSQISKGTSGKSESFGSLKSPHTYSHPNLYEVLLKICNFEE